MNKQRVEDRKAKCVTYSTKTAGVRERIVALARLGEAPEHPSGFGRAITLADYNTYSTSQMKSNQELARLLNLMIDTVCIALVCEHPSTYAIILVNNLPVSSTDVITQAPC
jgi:hypothetical protein